VVLSGTRVDPLNALAAELGERAFVCPADLKDPAAADSLIAAALEQAFEQVHELIEADGHDRAPAEARARYHGYYLSEAHLRRPGAACPVATLAGDVARAEPALKDAFGRGVNRMLDALEQQHPGGRKERRMAATREFAMLVGAALIARASDPETAERVLAACRPLSG